jgi:hypothetical protein
MTRVLRREPLLMTLAVIHGALFLVCLMLAAADPRQIAGANAWFKPAKFMLSVGVYLFTMACVLTPLDRARRGLATARRTIAAAMVIEIVIIAAQAARGTTSHYNNSTPLDAALFAVMGFFIVLNTLAAAWVLWLYIEHGPPLPEALLLAVRLGLGIFIVASLEAFMMVSRGAHTVGAPDGGSGIFFLNWSLTHGDLRIAHFAGLHALQGLPAVAWLSGSRKAVLGAAAAWALVFAVTLALAVAGKPLLSLPAR